MQLNVGGADRALRIIAGLVILGLGFYYHSWWGIIGLVPLLTGVVGWCPLYFPLHMSTAKKSGPAA